MKRAVVIDGNSLTYRMFYATYNLAQYAVEHNFQPVNALKLMIDTCFKIKTTGNYEYCLIAFDYGKKTFRHETYEEYKAGRKSMPQELVTQMPLVQESLKLMGYNVLSREGIEADDLIGSFCKVMNLAEVHVDVYSSDKDMLQLVNQYNSIHLIKSGLTDMQINTLANFSELNYGLEPKQIPDFKGIVGDSSDNLHGVKGIGLKTGVKLLLKYHTLENIYDHLEDLTPVNQKKFSESKDSAYMCKELATINTDQFDDKNTDDFKFKQPDLKTLYNMVKKYKISGLDKYFSSLDEQIDLFSL